MSIGLLRGTVALEPHHKEWEQSAKEVIKILKDTLKGDVVDAQHIGSTSITSISAKPIVDIAIGVMSFDKILKYNDVLKEKGIFYKKQDQPDQHLYVCCDLENKFQTHYLHAVIWKEEAWNNYINMRDYLNAYEDKAKEYSDLKQVLSEKYPNDRIAYTEGKSAFIESILIEAKKWREQK